MYKHTPLKSTTIKHNLPQVNASYEEDGQENKRDSTINKISDVNGMTGMNTTSTMETSIQLKLKVNLDVCHFVTFYLLSPSVKIIMCLGKYKIIRICIHQYVYAGIHAPMAMGNRTGGGSSLCIFA